MRSDIERAIEHEAWDEALALALTAWRTDRRAAIAALVIDLGARAARGRQAPTGKRVKDVLAAWCTRAARADPADLDVLLPTLAAGKSPDALARLDALAKAHPDGDPRVGRALVALLERPPFQAGTTKAFWKLLGETLPLHADDEVASRLAALEGKMVAILNGAETMGLVLEKIVASAHAAVPPSKQSFDDARIAKLLAERAPSPLEGIDAIDWTTLEDAYGSAEGVPEQLAAIAGDDPSACLDAIGAAWGNLCHQGTVYPASAAATPFLVRLVARPSQHHRFELLRLIASLGFGDPDMHAVFGTGNHEADMREAKRERDPDSGGAAFAETWEAVRAGASAYRALLDDADARVRRAAAQLLGLIATDPSTKALARAIANEKDEPTLAMELLALALLGRARGTTSELPLFHRHLHHAHINVRAAAAIGVACEAGKEIDKAALGVLRAAGETPKTSGAEWLFFDGDVGKHARAVETSLELQSDDELLDDLENELEAPELRDRKHERAHQLVARFFAGRRPTPKPLFEELSTAERRLLVATTKLGIAGLTHWGFFYPLESMVRYVGAGPRGAMDATLHVDGKALPAWKVVSDALHGHLDPAVAVRAFADAPRPIAAAAFEELTDNVAPYHLWYGTGHPDDEGGPYDRERLHGERFVDLQARIALVLGAEGEAVVNAVAARELAKKPYKSGHHCTLVALAKARAARARNEPPADDIDLFVAEGITTSPAQRVPRLTEEVLDLLPPERAEAITLAAVDVYRIGTTSYNAKTWDVIWFDDSLRYLRPTALGAAKVIEAIEAWDRVRCQMPKGEAEAPALPREAFIAFLAKVGAPARALCEASKARGHAAVDLLDEVLARSRS